MRGLRHNWAVSHLAGLAAETTTDIRRGNLAMSWLRRILGFNSAKPMTVERPNEFKADPVDVIRRRDALDGAGSIVNASAAQALAPLMEGVSPSIVDQMRGYIDRDVAGGFATRDEMIEMALDAAEADGAPFLRAEAERLADESLAAQRVAQADWPTQTDCDRLDAAFSALEAEGVIARQNFSCCGTCGSAEIWDEVDAARAQGRPGHGYAFYHQQDTESAVEGYGIYLNYGSSEEGPQAAVAVGRRVVEQLEKHGLRTDWDGSIEKRIGVSLDWKRRRAEPWVRQ